MDSNRQLTQPARPSSPDSAYAQDKPQWEHVEEVPTAVEKMQKRKSFFNEYYSAPPIDLTKDGAELCMHEWLDLAPENARHLSPQTRQLIESVDSMETALITISYLSGRRLSRPSSSSSRSSASTSPPPSSSSSAAGAPEFQDAVEDLARGLRRICNFVSQEVNEEVEEALLEKSRRELAKQKLKEDEQRGIQTMRQSLGLPVDDSNLRPRSRSTITTQIERIKALNEAGRKETR